ncbi:caffeoylshikimate esterase [Ananas comosus]|uniref:Caffeoylshikimate esterase n=1 Tax=Ananas comosus TaxID=4615 RepID=A0A6P5FGR7_ANACO|nr:caffeoylshikimate esterase [Ananas comosus]
MTAAGGGGGGGGGSTQYPNFWGSEPEEEEDYYAAHGVRGSKSFYEVPDGGPTLFTRSWRPLSSAAPRALIFMIHGYGNDISWTFQSTAVFLARSGFACFAADLPGHGRSHGLRAFVPDLDSTLFHLLSFFRSVRRDQDQDQDQDRGGALPCFLFGESMGAALCLLLHLRTPRDEWAGAVLVAPMCKISDRIRPRWPLPQILTFLARFAPTLPLVPTADLLEKSVKVPRKRLVAAANPMRYNGKPRLGTVVELLRVTDHLGARLPEVTLPFLVVHGSADEVTDPDVSRALYEAARSDDKTIRIYDGMLHSLLFGEPDDNVDLVRKDILAWLNERSC